MTAMNFQYHNIPKLALTPTDIDGATVNGAALGQWWREGRQITFLMHAGALTGAGTELTVKIQGQQISDDSWVNLPGFDGVTDLEMSGTGFGDGEAVETAVVMGTMSSRYIDAMVYKDMRITVTEAGGAATEVTCFAIVSDLYAMNETATDYLFSQQVKA